MRQHHLAERLQARVAIDQSGFLVFAGNFVDEPFEKPDGERNIDRRVKEDHADLRISEIELAVHQIDRNRDRDRRHHPGRQDEEQQIVGQRNPKPRKGVGGERAKKDRKERRTEADHQRINEARYHLGRPGNHHVVVAHELVVPGRRRRQASDEIRRLPCADGEQIDVAFERGLEDHLGRISDRVALRFERGGPDPYQRQNRDHSIEYNECPGEALHPRRRLDDGMGGRFGGGGHRCFTLLSTLT